MLNGKERPIFFENLSEKDSNKPSLLKPLNLIQSLREKWQNLHCSDELAGGLMIGCPAVIIYGSALIAASVSGVGLWRNDLNLIEHGIKLFWASAGMTVAILGGMYLAGEIRKRNLW